MTKSQCYNEIERNNQLISQYQTQINTLEKEIEELKTAEYKVTNMKTTLSSCKQTGMARLTNTSKVNNINSRITSKIFNSIDDLFSGSEYTRVFNGLGKAIERIQDEIYKKRQEINSLNSKIAGCRNTITNMNNTISRIEAEEREAARREAERREAARREAERQEAARREAERKAAEAREAAKRETRKRK